MKRAIPVTSSSMPNFQEYVDEIKGLWDSKWLTNQGRIHDQLEAELAKYLLTPQITLYANGHLALESIIAALNLTGEVITTPFTFVSTTHAIVNQGLIPVFCDINKEDYTIRADAIEALITEETSAIVAVHVYGNICENTEIERIAQKYKLKVIYDAAHAFGITVGGLNVANLGDASMFSFHATKVFNSIEGGAITYKNPDLKSILNARKNFGITDEESVDYIAGNAKMNEFQAAMGLCNLRNIDVEIQKRKQIFERYIEQLSDIAGLKLPKIPKGIKSNYAYFPIVFDQLELLRDPVQEALKQKNIFSRKYFYPLTSDFACYRDRFNSGYTPVASYIAERVLTLPLYADLTLEDVDTICAVIKAEMQSQLPALSQL